MAKRNLALATAFGLATLLGSCGSLLAEEVENEALLRSMGNAKVTLAQGIAQVAKGIEVPTEAKYEMEGGKLMLSVYTSAKGFETAAEDNSFNEYPAVKRPQAAGLRKRKCLPISSISPGRRSTTRCCR